MSSPITRITRTQLAWLESEAARWQAESIIDAATRDRILERYEAESFEGRSTSALIVVAVLICAVGLLLLIGYNWSRISPTVKVSLILAAVAAAFVSAAMSYRAGRHRLGETLAFSGTLIFGNAIWLIAQVLHISGRFPDGFLWFGIGALATAWLVRSRWVGTAAAVLIVVWVIAEGLARSGAPYLFLVLWPLTLAAGYALAAPAMIGVGAIALAPWVVIAVEPFDSAWTVAAVLLAGAALYAAAAWHRERPRIALAWQTSGLLVQLVILVPLMIQDVHRELIGKPAGFHALSVAVAAILLTVALSPILRRRTVSEAASAAIAAAAGAWAIAAAAGAVTPLASTLLFSAAALLLGVALIRTALRTGWASDLVFGVLFMMAFLIVRWVSLVNDLLLSGLLLLATGAGLLLLAKLWRGRDRSSASAGRRS